VHGFVITQGYFLTLLVSAPFSLLDIVDWCLPQPRYSQLLAHGLMCFSCCAACGASGSRGPCIVYRCFA